MLARFGLTGFLFVLAPVCLMLALSVGSLPLSVSEIWATLGGSGSEVQHAVIFDLRLPRALSAFAVGGLLSLAGVLLQVLLRNPLADPYIMGISGGASVFALLALTAGASAGTLTGSAFVGGMVSMIIVFGLAHGRQAWTPTRLLLTGVVVAAGWGALISFLLTIASNENVRGMLFWLMGDLSHSRQPAPSLIILVLALIGAYVFARALNVLARGELTAATLGVNPFRLKIAIYVIASLVTATAVTVAGNVAFVGLIIPHMTRLLSSSDHRILVPNAVLLGGCFMVIADTAARTLLAPVQLPVGVITAFIGVPLFLFLLHRSRLS
ncbi:MAG: iron ABC transporter permease [Gammaproteobacteria bacterium]|nr:iron ABC transporter permease [Gammaproteobacteria bacterium]